MPTIERLKKKYKGEWLAIEITKEEKGEPIAGKLLLHSRGRDQIWKKVPQKKGRIIYVTYAGPPLEEGYAAAFRL